MITSTALRPRLDDWKVGIVALLVNLCAFAAGSTSVQAAEVGMKEPVRIVAFGDSLTAGYLLRPDEAFPAQLAAALKSRGHKVEISNAGVSGDTTGAGLQRFDWAIAKGTEAVILELGANDALRGMPPEEARDNLDQIITRLKALRIEVLLAGMRAPKNWGEDYAQAFDSMYRELAARHDLIHYPFFLEGVALDASLNLDDGLHPNAKGVARIVEGILPHVKTLIARALERRGTAHSKS